MNFVKIDGNRLAIYPIIPIGDNTNRGVTSHSRITEVCAKQRCAVARNNRRKFEFACNTLLLSKHVSLLILLCWPRARYCLKKESLYSTASRTRPRLGDEKEVKTTRTMLILGWETAKEERHNDTRTNDTADETNYTK